MKFHTLLNLLHHSGLNGDLDTDDDAGECDIMAKLHHTDSLQ